MPEQEIVLVLDDLALERGGRRLVAGVSLALRRGERLLLVGPNGSGKSTLALTIAGVLPGPAAGRLVRPPRVGLCPQEPAFPMRHRVGDHLMEVALLGGADRASAARDVGARLEEWDLAPAERTPIGRLSRGWRQRLALARAFLGAPDLVVLDEPLTALDPEGVAALRRVLGRGGGPAVLVLAPPDTGCEGLAPAHSPLVPLAAPLP